MAETFRWWSVWVTVWNRQYTGFCMSKASILNADAIKDDQNIARYQITFDLPSGITTEMLSKSSGTTWSSVTVN